MSDAALKKLFEACDADEDGALSRADIEATLHKLAGKHQGSRAFFAAADKNGNGVLEYQEFVDVLLRSKAADSTEDQEKSEPPASAYMEETGLRSFMAKMLQEVDGQKPKDPYLWMMQYLAKHRPKTVPETSKGADAGKAGAKSSGTSESRPSKEKKWRVNTSAVLKKTPKKLLDVILQGACWEQVESPADDDCHLYFVRDSKGFLSRLNFPGVRGAEPVTQLPEGAWINRLPGMGHLCDKVNMALGLRFLQRLWPEKFSFWPKSWLLPAEIEKLKDWLEKHKGETVIVKPSDGSLGEGIFLAQSCSDLEAKMLAKPQWGAGFGALAQRYLPKPLLIGGLKFDLRLYAVVTSTDPLNAYLCKEGLARFCTSKYEAPTAANANQHYMHLTNFSVNKKSAGFVKAADPFDPDSMASKRPLSTLMRQIEAQEAAAGRVFKEEDLFASFEEVVIVLLQALAPVLNVTYTRVAKEATPKPKAKAKAKAKSRIKKKGGDSDEESEEEEDEDSEEGEGFQPQCFQVLGVDVLLDEKLQPWLLEINGRPSMDIDEPVRMSEAPEGMRRCICRDMDGEGHVHLQSPVDTHVKTAALEGAMQIALGGKVPENYAELDFSKHSPSEDLEDTMQSIAQLYEAAGGSQKAFTTYGARKALAGAIKAGLSQHDLDAAVQRWKHQGYRQCGELEQDTAEIGVLDFAALLQEVAVLRKGAEDEEPLEALSSLIGECDLD